MNKTYKKIKYCRISKDRNLYNVGKIGPLTLTGTFLKNQKDEIPITPVDMVFSRKSFLLQLKHNYNQSLLFGENYGYRSSLNQTMKNHLVKKSKNISKILNFSKETLYLILGVTMNVLNSFSNNLVKYGVDPTSKNLRNIIIKISKLFLNF